MSTWNVIEVRNNAADQTVIFAGDRTSIGDSENLFESCTLASIKSSVVDITDQQCIDNVRCYIRSEKLFYVVSKTIGVFTDLNCCEIDLSLVFEHLVDILLITDDAKYCFVGLRNGSFQLLDISEKAVILESNISNYLGDVTVIVNAYCQVYRENEIVIFVITLKGDLYRVKITNLKEKCLLEKDIIQQMHCQVEHTAFNYPYIFLNGNEGGLIIYNMETDDRQEDNYLDIVKVLDYGADTFLVLDVNGNLIQICSKTLLKFQIANTKFKDMILVLNTLKNKMLFVAVTRQDEFGKSQLQSFESYSDFQSAIFSIKQCDIIHLIDPDRLHDNYMYLMEVNSESSTIEYRVQVVSEVCKEKRLERLLKQHRFDEAEEFASLFDLDKTEILKGRSIALLTKQNYESDDAHNLIDILEKVNDIPFRLECCYNMYELLNDFQEIEVILGYCYEQVKISSERYNSFTENNLKQLETISKLLNKFHIFIVIQKHDSNLTWDYFAKNSLLDIMNRELKMGNIETAIILYNRMDGQLTIDDIEYTLQILRNLPLKTYQVFLYTFVPISLSKVPISISFFVNWLKLIVFHMESSKYGEFPENAIEFSNEFIKLLVHNNTQSTFLMESMYSLYRKSVDELAVLLNALNRLQFILSTYQIKIYLKEYLKGSKYLIRALLNVTLHNDRFDTLYEKFLYNFILENNFNPDDILFEEIESLISSKECNWVESVSRILEKINSVDQKLQAIHKIAVSAKVPWAQSIRDLVSTALKHDHPLVQDILKRIQDEPRMTILTKYNLQKHFKTMKFRHWIYRMFYCNMDGMIDDVFMIGQTAEEKETANQMLFHELVKKGRLDDAVNVLKRIPSEEGFTFCQDVLNLIIHWGKDSDSYKNIKNYSSLLSFLKRLYENTRRSHNHDLMWTFEVVVSFFQVKEIYEDITISDIFVPKRRSGICDILVENAITDIETNTSDVAKVQSLINGISNSVNIPKSDLMIKFLEKSSHPTLVYQCAEYYYLYEDDPTKLCKLAALIIKSVSSINGGGVGEVTMQDFTIYGSIDLGDINMVVKNIKFAQLLITKANLQPEHVEYYSCHEFLYVINNFFGVLTENITRNGIGNLKNQSYLNTIPSFRTLNVTQDMFQIALSYIRFYDIPNVKYLSYFSEADVDLSQDNVEIKNQIKSSVQHLCVEGQALAAYHMVRFLKNYLRKKNASEEVFTVLNSLLLQQCIPQLLEKILSLPNIDFNFAYTLLISLKVEQLFKLINKILGFYRTNALKLNVIIKLFVKVLKYHNIAPDPTYVQLGLMAKWWLKIKNCKVPMKTFFITPIVKLLPLLLTNNCLKLEIMQEFCSDFKLDVEVYYNIYLRTLLTSWEPDYEIKETADGKVTLIMKSSEDELFEKCENVLKFMNSKNSIAVFAEKYAASINSYHYEAFICLFRILSTFSSLNSDKLIAKQQLLMFLKTYTRVGKPTNLELEEWFAAFPNSLAVDPLSKYRLPFSQIFFTNDIWQIIRPEITLKTYTLWFKILPFLHQSLNIDDICSLIVKDLISNGCLEQRSGNGWALTAVHKTLFEEIDSCVQHMKDFEKATSIMNHLMIHTPKGADQINAAVLCLKYAQKYKESCEENDPIVSDVYEKIRIKYLKLSVNQILHTCKLDVEQYGELLLQPNELIDILYTHEDIVKSVNAIILSLPNINDAVDKIATLHDINILKKRKELLNGFLSNGDSLNLANVLRQPSEETESINLKRAAYICQSGSLECWQKYLIDIGTNDEQPTSLRVKANALKCLTMISDDKTIEAVIDDLSYNAFLNFVDKLYLLSNLEQRGLSMTIDDLNAFNKKSLLRRLAQDAALSGSNPVPLNIMGDLCMVYYILDTKYWSRIVNASIQLNLRSQLEKYINFWSGILDSNCKKFYIDAWQYVIDDSFSKCGSDEESVEFDLCVKNVLMVQSCPVLNSLNFDNVFDKLCQLNRFEFAAVIIQYMPNEKQEKCIERILENSNEISLLSLREYGICGTRLVTDLLSQ